MTPELWIRQRGTFPTTAQTLVRDLAMRLVDAHTVLSRLACSRRAVRLAPGRYVHADTFPEHRMSTLILLDAAGAERHRAAFPNRIRAEIARRVVEIDIRDRAAAVRVIGTDPADPTYTVSNVYRAMIQPTPLPAPPSDDIAFDARARAAGDDR